MPRYSKQLPRKVVRHTWRFTKKELINILKDNIELATGDPVPEGVAYYFTPDGTDGLTLWIDEDRYVLVKKEGQHCKK